MPKTHSCHIASASQPGNSNVNIAPILEKGPVNIGPNSRKCPISEARGNSKATGAQNRPAPSEQGVQKCHQQRSATPPSPLKGPWKQTNKPPGLIRKWTSHYKAEVKAGKVAKAVAKKAVAAAKKDVVKCLAKEKIS
jgi:hypothetical protein